MWKYPWNFNEGFTICAGLILTGFFLNTVIGPIPDNLLTFPLNAYFGIIFIAALILLGLFGTKNKYLRWFSGYYAAISSIASFLLLVVIMGFTRQLTNPMQQGLLHPIFAFSVMLKSWAFILLMFYLLVVLGLTTIRRIASFHYKNDIPFVLNHAGLFIALFSGILGQSDIQRLQMAVNYQNPEWRAVSTHQKIVELPLAIQLDSFIIEEYPPKLMLVNMLTGEPTISGEEGTKTIERVPGQIKIGKFDIDIIQKLDLAAPYRNDDSSQFVSFNSNGAASALEVKVSCAHQTPKSGWLSAGSYAFRPRYLLADSLNVLVMPKPEIRKYISKVTIFKKDGATENAIIEVNKPYKTGKWTIYQLSYDQEKGRWSDVSILELVSDPWLPLVYTGFIMMITGALTLLFGKRKTVNHELE